MTWRNEVEELNRRRASAKAQGGPDAIARQHAQGRLTIRERIDALLDPGSFGEHGRATASLEHDDQDKPAGYVPANYVIGMGAIAGRRVAVGGEDFTLKGGSPNAAGLRKSIYAEHMAVQYRMPLVRLLEGGGGSVRRSNTKGGTHGEAVTAPRRFKIIADALSEVPVVSIGLGAVAGFPAGRLVAAHFALMTRYSSQVLTAGPKIVERALGVNLNKDELGGAEVHATSGVVDNVAEDELDAFEQARRFLSYLPDNVWKRAPRTASEDPVDRIEEELLSLVPKQANTPFDMRKLVRLVMDCESCFELGASYGESQIAMLARLNGQPVGVLANDCRYFAGAMTAKAAQKYRRFVELCDTFHLPIVNFVDQPGFMIGPEAEREGTIRYGMAAVSAAVQSSVPWASVQVHKGFGVATAAHFSEDNYVISWPSVETGALPLEGGVAVAFHREIDAADDARAKREEIEEKLREARSPFPAAESFAVHELIDPRETRPLLSEWIEWIQPKLDTLLGKTSFGFRP